MRLGLPDESHNDGMRSTRLRPGGADLDEQSAQAKQYCGWVDLRGHLRVRLIRRGSMAVDVPVGQTPGPAPERLGHDRDRDDSEEGRRDR